ncbi:hypothetical protein AB4Z34_01600 [Ensifer sp. 2YAB10]|uniref:hypothetical protein n=1 Tax=unclassified Ensifer TaxID=2633371 RepID=UPI003F92743C
MAFWNKISGLSGDNAKVATQATPDQQVEKALDRVWDDASTAIKFYVDFRTKYNLPPSPEMWRDDFALGFLDGIGFIHFSALNPGIPGALEALHSWNLMVIRNDVALQDAWLSIVGEAKGHNGRGKDGFLSALILESWRLKREITPGALDYLARHEAEYKEQHPDATQFNMDHWLIMSRFVMPLIMADKEVHPLLKGL